VLEDTSVVMATREQNEMHCPPNSTARGPPHQISHAHFTHDYAGRAVSPRSSPKYGIAARASSPQMLNHNAHNVMARTASPQLHVSTYIQGDIGPSRNQVARPPSPQITIPSYMQNDEDYHAMTLGRKSSNNSLHRSNSSGYSSQHTTPTCSEDTIASHGKLKSLIFSQKSRYCA